jgi:HD-GYP domain-containing protein (c-di-GMP phosphodiesterase class II)
VGKIAVSDAILLKPGELTPEEFAQMKTHVTVGAKMLSGGRFPLMQLAEQIALTHHEHWDGNGYLGLAQEAIPLPGRIVTVADVFDALISERSYKSAWSIDKAIEEIKRQRGHQFDPRVVDAFLDVSSPLEKEEQNAPEEHASAIRRARFFQSNSASVHNASLSNRSADKPGKYEIRRNIVLSTVPNDRVWLPC